MANTTGSKSLDRIGNDPRVSTVYRDDDGIWVNLHMGFCSDPETHGYHEMTVREVLAAFSPSQCPVTCPCQTPRIPAWASTLPKGADQ